MMPPNRMLRYRGSSFELLNTAYTAHIVHPNFGFVESYIP